MNFFETASQERMPSMVDLAPHTKRAFHALERGDVGNFIMSFSKQQDMKRPFSITISNEQTMVNFCIEHNFKGIRNSPKENGHDLWKHEIAHLKIAQKYEIPAIIRIAELHEPLFAKHEVYVDLDMPSVTKKFENNPIQIMQFIGEILIAPHHNNLGYESETSKGNKLIKLARRRRVASFFSRKK